MSGFFNISGKFGGKTKPKRSLSAVRPLFLCQPYCNNSIVKGNFKTIVQLPKYVDANEWLAVNGVLSWMGWILFILRLLGLCLVPQNGVLCSDRLIALVSIFLFILPLAVNGLVFDFYNYINMFYGSVSDFCTLRDCPTMSAGAGFEYLWMDGQKKTSRVPAPQYIDFVMSWIQTLVNDESTFPTKDGRDFPATFQQTVRAIFKQLIRVFAHIYHSHYDKMLSLCQEGHFNSLFAHFVSFGREFDLLDKKDIVPLQELIDIMDSNGILC